MGRSTLRAQAPENPHRRLDGEYAVAMNFAGGPPPPRRSDTDEGPGLTAGDLDRMCRQHFRDGHAAAERAARLREDERRGLLADAYDDGYVAGRLQRASGLALDVHTRLLDLAARLGEAERGAKSKAHEHLPLIREAYADLAAFLVAVVEQAPDAVAHVAAGDDLVAMRGD